METKFTTGYLYDEFSSQTKTGEEDFLNDTTFTESIIGVEANLVYMNVDIIMQVVLER